MRLVDLTVYLLKLDIRKNYKIKGTLWHSDYSVRNLAPVTTPQDLTEVGVTELLSKTKLYFGKQFRNPFSPP